MGTVHVDAAVRYPADPGREWRASFLVGTGAVDSLVPRRWLEAIGLRPERRRAYETADGRRVAMDVAVGEFEAMGELAGGLVIFGDDDAEPLLGATILASAGIEVDPRNRRLRKLPSVRLKALRRRRS